MGMGCLDTLAKEVGVGEEGVEEEYEEETPVVFHAGMEAAGWVAAQNSKCTGILVNVNKLWEISCVIVGHSVID